MLITKSSSSHSHKWSIAHLSVSPAIPQYLGYFVSNYKFIEQYDTNKNKPNKFQVFSCSLPKLLECIKYIILRRQAWTQQSCWIWIRILRVNSFFATGKQQIGIGSAKLGKQRCRNEGHRISCSLCPNNMNWRCACVLRVFVWPPEKLTEQKHWKNMKIYTDK